MGKPRSGGGAGPNSRKTVIRHPADTSTTTADVRSDRQQQQRIISFSQQQRLLDVFAAALRPTLASPQLAAALQAVKRALFERDFAGAFLGGTGGPADGGIADGGTREAGGNAHIHTPPPLDAYAARWSPTRALCYAAILSSPLVLQRWQANTTAKQPLRMVALGGGAAETVAFGALLADGLVDAGPGPDRGHIVLVDSAPWSSVVQKLCAAMTMTTATTDDLRQPSPLIHPSDRLAVDVRQLDILQLFTAGGLGAAAAFLLRMTAATAAAPGTLLLVVDSPGSYAETTVGTQARRYPMRWLLDKILLQDASDAQLGPAWTRLHQDDSIWLRLPPALVYPIRLEDMRYQIHLYVRT
ncbi:ylr063wp-like protein [Grosmannia clavigera kw1407]|uniref:Ylr063wp-like protein n=1 Tax=Grosmannia clavigera (strain kw1407 / UAMH 11150) TaxID=655863 RepID=F0XLR7_GROCL|nr:ylr063wp-like protein [Grosmannia clavigera kw1407]EFX01357.1 ylr063wp-like protein [Grosmannia clavigera kw1407]